MIEIIQGYSPRQINLAPATLAEEVTQNVAVILSTPRYSVPLDRGLGMSQRFVDKPMQVAQAILAAEVNEAIAAYEPRATIRDITFEQDESVPGKLIPIVEVEITDE